MKHKHFAIFSLIWIAASVLLLSQLVHYSLLDNPLFRQSEQRVSEAALPSDIVFVGDSSLGEGLNEHLFERLSGMKTANLSLTSRAHNFAATYNLIRHTLHSNPNVKYIVIMQSPLAWNYDFAVLGYCSTLSRLDSNAAIRLGFINRFTCVTHEYMDLSQIGTTWQQKRRGYNAPAGGTLPVKKTYKNRGKDIVTEIRQNRFYQLGHISADVSKELKMIDTYLEDKNVTIFYVQGSLHQDLANRYLPTLARQHEMVKKLKHVTLVEHYLYPENSDMGDTPSHVDISYKDTATEYYFSILKPYLR